MINVRNLAFSYHGAAQPAVRNISFEVAALAGQGILADIGRRILVVYDIAWPGHQWRIAGAFVAPFSTIIAR